MKHAAFFPARQETFERLLTERAGIGQRQIEELGEVHTRADRYLRSVKASAAHAAQQDAPQVRPVSLSDTTATPHPLHGSRSRNRATESSAAATPREMPPNRIYSELSYGLATPSAGFAQNDRCGMPTPTHHRNKHP